MATQVAATYLPDYQCIRLKSVFPAFADPAEPQGFQTPHQSGFFIHEWFHYLHNNSTIHGAAAYSHAVLLWSNVRAIIDHNGLCIGDEHLPDQNFADIRKQYKHRLNARTAQTNEIGSNLRLNDLDFISCTKETTYIEDDEKYPCTTLLCKAIIKVDDSELKIKIGCHEIIEYIAFALESKFLRNLKESPLPTPISPYMLADGLASLISPSLEKDTILRCAIFSLQFPDPPSYFSGLLHWSEKNKKEHKDPDIELTKKASEHLKTNIKVMNENVDLIEKILPLDSPFPRAVKHTAQLIKSNYIYRITNPFFEIELVNFFSRFGGAAINAAMDKHGVGFLIQERFGPGDEFMRDLMLDISLPNKPDTDILYGRRVAQAAFSYVLEFFRVEHDKIKQPASMRCPFFTSCSSEYRRENPRICSTTPWESQKLEHSKICYFGEAVINTKNHPPSDLKAQKEVCKNDTSN
ncbi:hypothetical protein [Pseudomonas sp. A014]|uniref:hypothetical protein n=1 Tax=Pseudomonas sp. A014 TaxID=3458058 RepID=UPI0040364125